MIINEKHILVGITGGIAAYKAATLIRLLRKAQAEVRVIMTESARQFITPLTLAALSENEVGLDLFEQAPTHEIRHITWADWADLAIVAPATANSMAKVAHGQADDLLSSTILSLQCPLFLAPAMHHQMWTHPATQNNLTLLRNFGYHIIDPGEGDLASGDSGPGRMREPEEIVTFIETL